jgi:Flp pilus assembly protein TadG
MMHDRRGTTAIEFALVGLVLLTLMFGGIEYARLFWTWEALQLAGDDTARCVGIGSSDCAMPSTYAVTAAGNYGASGLLASNVQVVNATTSAPCNQLAGNSAVSVTLSLPFTSPASTLIPGLNRTLTTTSCYPLTGQ